MQKTIDGKFRCTICDLVYSRDIDAISCEQNHNTIYIAMNREDLFKLIQFLYTRDESLLSSSLMNTLLKYRKNSY